jgi:mercuric reductase
VPANILGHQQAVDYTSLPPVTFTSPQLASPASPIRRHAAPGHACDCSCWADGQDVPRALANNDTQGALKIVAEVGPMRLSEADN